jgi:hypothetical protein
LLSAVRTSHPRLRLRLTGTWYQPPIESLTITLPRGLSFTTNRSTLATRVSISGGRHDLSPHERRLTATFWRPAQRSSTSISAGSGALDESNTLKHRIAQLLTFNRTHKHSSKRTMTLTIQVRLTPTVGYPIDTRTTINVG